MPNRLIKESICTSPNIDALSREAEVFFYRLIVHCDDFGRMDARLPILRAKCFPLQLDRVTDIVIAALLNELVNADLITLYGANGGSYLQMRTWEKHQQMRAKHSKYPQPPPYDSTRNHLLADDFKCPPNPIQSNPIESNPIPDEDDNERQQALADLQSLGLFNRPMKAQFDDMWPELSGRRDWVGKAITIARDGNARSPLPYALKILANSLHTGHEPGYVNGSPAQPASSAPLKAAGRAAQAASERSAAGIAALALQGVTEDDPLFYPKLNAWIEGTYGK